MIYGYARCSTDETRQDINRQVRELKEKVFIYPRQTVNQLVKIIIDYDKVSAV